MKKTIETARAKPIWGGHLIEMTPSMIKIKMRGKISGNLKISIRRHRKNRWNPTWTKEVVQAQIKESLEWGYNGLDLPST
jgi:hypothetical protein